MLTYIMYLTCSTRLGEIQLVHTCSANQWALNFCIVYKTTTKQVVALFGFY